MLDIISLIREKLFRQPKLYGDLAGEEVSEKQTTKLGYLLLVCMFIAIITSAQWTLSTIREIPDMPEEVPYCLEIILHNFKPDDPNTAEYYYGSDCLHASLISENPKFDFTNDYEILLEPSREIQGYVEIIRQRNSDLERETMMQKNNQENYNTSLTEKIATENSKLYDTQDIQSAIGISRSNIQSIQNEITDNETKIEQIRSQHSSAVSALASKIELAEEDYRQAYLLYKIYVALLSLLFAASVLTILYRLYVRQKIKNSPHTIIFSIATFAYGLILLQISCLFIWDIIPHKILEIIINFFSVFEPLLYLVQFLWPILIVAIFGYLVFRIQRRLYSPQNILKRFISDKKCPNCGNAVDCTKPFCPLCSHEIQIRCPTCKQFSVKDLPYCSNCGKTMKNK